MMTFVRKKASDPYNTTKYHQHNHKRYNKNLAFQKGEAKQNDIIRSNLQITIYSLKSLSFYHSSPLSIEIARKKKNVQSHRHTHTHKRENFIFKFKSNNCYSSNISLSMPISYTKNEKNRLKIQTIIWINLYTKEN